jgi:hypothetical protein
VSRWSTYLDMKQAHANDALPEVLRSPEARRRCRWADAGVATTAIGVVAACLLVGFGVGSPVAYVIAAVLTVAGVVTSIAAIASLHGLERRAE